MKAAPKIVGEERLAVVFSTHLKETERHERLVRERLEALGADPSRVKDLAGRAGGWGMVLFARVQPDTPGKLVFHAFAYEKMELATYELLARAAVAAGDEETATVAREIGAEEGEMARRLETLFDVAVEASLKDGEEAIAGQLDTYLADVHALEQQALQMLEAAPKLVSEPKLEAVFREHLEQTRRHVRLVDERLAARDASPSRLKDAALRAGALNLGGFFGAQPDTTAKLAGFAFAFENLEVAAYELLARTAERAGDSVTATVAREIGAEERSAATALAETWDGAMAQQMSATASAD